MSVEIYLDIILRSPNKSKRCPTNKTDRHNITEILLKVALNTITLTLKT